MTRYFVQRYMRYKWTFLLSSSNLVSHSKKRKYPPSEHYYHRKTLEVFAVPIVPNNALPPSRYLCSAIENQSWMKARISQTCNFKHL